MHNSWPTVVKLEKVDEEDKEGKRKAIYDIRSELRHCRNIVLISVNKGIADDNLLLKATSLWQKIKTD